ncbi:N,N-dimethylformamidase beta subunit family domain-containing protein [Mesorhizobium sp. CO1-1-8]|uniref:N,N-dimethylformamidase beta subunit family domain-containing protein n=1 Tax=Mesorhizobium sp. CO1-1-8 TaxID=2876631 RepID=UPI001CD12CE2|nr:N,N-dimethylformamidase beta subunit family domain-containing protein [Mesorhizobium sp. CO1-1-8]MBZ9772436.1 hypothetical protein [Mesorhizobium sp. CO1-1-8]
MAISTKHPQVQATLERITRGPTAQDAAGAHQPFGEQVPGIDITIPGTKQETAMGSFVELPLGVTRHKSGFSLHLWFWASVPDWKDDQAILSCGSNAEEDGLALLIRNKKLIVSLNGRDAASSLEIDARIWYSLILCVEHGSNVTKVTLDVAQVSGLPGAKPHSVETINLTGALATIDNLLLAAAAVDMIGSAVSGFNGKIGSPSFFGRLLGSSERAALHVSGAAATSNPDLHWNFAEHFSSLEIREKAGRAPAGSIHNGAERGVTGHNWTGASDSFVEAPGQYGAIYFHSDEMVDSNWSYNLEFELPAALESGIYAVRLQVGGHEDRYPLFVRGRKSDRADVLFIVPTNTYLAYGNDHFAGADLSASMMHEKLVSEDEKYLNAHPEFGVSAYDVHADGSPVRFSSRRRPLVNVRPHYPNWLTGSFRHFAVDLFVVEWLERSAYSYHVVTDEDVHFGGKDLLSRYKVVVTGSHPEYWSNKGLTGLENYLRAGGRLMYLGGNGFYWVTTHDPDRPWIVEIRRDNGGLRSWDPPPGERTHIHTGEPGGLWRYRGRGPNKICGVAFAAEGWSKAQGYKRSAESYQAPLSSFFEGIEDDVIGDFGYVLNGAAGDELDRFDLQLGSPPQSQIMASATGFGAEYQIVNEDVCIPMPKQDGSTRPDRVRSDMVYIPIGGGGGVFSVGSIAFAGAIAWNGFDNNVARLVNNVLRKFVEE